jgi:hypothetical protein
MVRPRWHDALIVVAVLAVVATGIWALWWEDVRGWWRPEAPAVDPAIPAAGQT